MGETGGDWLLKIGFKIQMETSLDTASYVWCSLNLQVTTQLINISTVTKSEIKTMGYHINHKWEESEQVPLPRIHASLKRLVGNPIRCQSAYDKGQLLLRNTGSKRFIKRLTSLWRPRSGYHLYLNASQYYIQYLRKVSQLMQARALRKVHHPQIAGIRSDKASWRNHVATSRVTFIFICLFIETLLN